MEWLIGFLVRANIGKVTKIKCLPEIEEKLLAKVSFSRIEWFFGFLMPENIDNDIKIMSLPLTEAKLWSKM